MSSLRDLFNLRHLNYNEVVNAQPPERLRNLPQPPKEAEWDIRSGEPEPTLGHVSPEAWLPPTSGLKALALLGSMRKVGSAVNPESIRRVVAAVSGQRTNPQEVGWVKDRLKDYLANRGGTPMDEIANLGRNERLNVVPSYFLNGDPNGSMNYIDSSYKSVADLAREKAVRYSMPSEYPIAHIQNLPTPEERIAGLYAIAAKRARSRVPELPTEAGFEDLPRALAAAKEHYPNMDPLDRSRMAALESMYNHAVSSSSAPYLGPFFNANRSVAQKIPYGSLGDRSLGAFDRSGIAENSLVSPFSSPVEEISKHLTSREGLDTLLGGNGRIPASYALRAEHFPDSTYDLVPGWFAPIAESIKNKLIRYQQGDAPMDLGETSLEQGLRTLLRNKPRPSLRLVPTE